MDIVEKNQTIINAIFKEAQIKKVKIGQKAYISFDVNPDLRFKGKVVNIAKTAMNTGHRTEQNQNLTAMEY